MFDLSSAGHIAPKTAGNIPDPLVSFLGAPTLAASTGGIVEVPFQYQALVAWFDLFGVCCGITALSNQVGLTNPSNALLVSGLPAAPSEAVTLGVFAQYQYPGNPQVFGPAPVTGAQGLPASTSSILLTTPHVGWFGGAPNVQQGNVIPVAGGLIAVKFSQNRTFVSHGDLGVRTYNQSTKVRTGQITATGDANVQNNPLAAPLFDVYVDPGGHTWLMVPNYTESGGHDGVVALDIEANPDNPPATFIGSDPGFTVRMSTGLLMNTLSGPTQISHT